MVIEHNGCIVDDAGCRKAGFQADGVNEWFEISSGLALGLHHSVVFAVMKVITADHGNDGAI